MTLVIAGYTFGHASGRYVWKGSKTNASIDTLGEQPSGIFIASDSAITSGNQILLSGFRKIYPITVRLMQPYFVGEYFRDYRIEHSSQQILVAFAGSTLTAQHYLNNMVTHLGDLRITFGGHVDGRITYKLIMPCAKNDPLEAPGTVWGEDTFTPAEMSCFRMTADDIADVIEHSLIHAMQSAARYKLDAAGFKSLETPFVAGIKCPSSNQYKIYKFEIKRKDNIEPIEMGVIKSFVTPDTVAVLGMSGQFDHRAQAVYANARTSGEKTDEKVFDFLNLAIDEVQALGHSEIDHPSFLKCLCDTGISTRRHL